MSFFKNKGMRKVKLQGKTTFDQDVYCDIASVYKNAERLERKVIVIYDGLRDTNEMAMQEEFDPTIWAKNLDKLCDSWEKIEDLKLFSNSQEKEHYLKRLMQTTNKLVFEPSFQNSIFYNYFENLSILKEIAEAMTPELIKSAENGFNYYDIYVNISNEQKAKLESTTKKMQLDLKKLADLDKLAKDAFEIEKFESLVEPVVRFDNLLNRLKDNFNELNELWNGELLALNYQDKKGQDYLSFCVDSNYKNASMLNVIVNYQVEIPQIKRLDKQYEYEGPMLADLILR